MIFDADGDQDKSEEILVSINNLPTTTTGTSSSSSTATSTGSYEWKVGKDMNVGPFKMTIDKVSFVEDQGYPNGNYLKVDMVIYNKRGERVELNFSQTTLTDDKKFVYDVDYLSKIKLELTLLFLFVYIFYFGFLEGLNGQTLGKKWMGIQVVWNNSSSKLVGVFLRILASPLFFFYISEKSYLQDWSSKSTVVEA